MTKREAMKLRKRARRAKRRREQCRVDWEFEVTEKGRQLLFEHGLDQERGVLLCKV